MRVKWLHLSDIHFNYKNYNSELLRKDFVERIAELSKRESFTHLFLSGDILYRNGTPDSKTISFLEQLIASMSLSKECVVIVPGNHDHDREVSKTMVSSLFEGKKEDQLLSTIDGIDETTIQSLLNAFSNYNDCISAFLGEQSHFDFSTPHVIYDCKRINIVQLNTAWLDYSSDETSKRFIGSYQLQKSLDMNEALLNQPEALNIAIGHHPLEELVEEERNRVLDLFSRYNIGLYFCGHLHQPAIKVFREKDVLEIVCPGGYKDGFSEGGYVWGIIDTDCDFYKAEVYNWNDGSWSIESKLDGTDECGNYYFNTKRFTHKSDIVAVDVKLYDGHIPKQQLDSSIGCTNYEIITAEIPLSDQQGTPIQNLARTIKSLAEQGKVVHLYPLAPIPTLISLGFELQSNAKLIIHQYDRDADRWVHSSPKDSTKISISKKLKGNTELIVKISCSILISDKAIAPCVSLDKCDVIEIEADPKKLGYPLFANGVKTVVGTVIDCLNSCIANYDRVHIFAAIPAGLAVELGRSMLRSVYNNICLYNYSGGKYSLASVINPSESATNEASYEYEVSNVVPFGGNGKIVPLPIVGEIACGDITEAIENSSESFPVSDSILSSGNYFFLRARGDSMVNANIDDGDLILIRQQSTANDGEIVVARVENDTTLKRLYHDKSRRLIILRSENDSYKDQEYKDVEVQGVAVMVIKQLR